MKVNELRVGNKVLFKDKIVEVVGISGIVYSFNTVDITVLINKKFEMHSLKSMKPIPLTEDILLKCGFDKGKSKFWEQWDKGLISLLWDKELKSWMYVPNIMIKWSVELKYLHELQNLYFAITRKELEVQL